MHVAVLGGGGGTLAMALAEALPKVTVDLVELHGAALAVAQTHFGVPRGGSDRIRLHHMDALEFMAKADDQTFDAVMIDVCGADAEDGAPLELPPREFVDERFLQNEVFRTLRPGGVATVNVLGDSTNLTSIALKFKAVFGRVQVLASDPNHYFFARKGLDGGRDALPDLSPEAVVAAASAAGVARVARDVIQMDILATAENRKEEMLVGWLSCAEFLERLKTENCGY
jgi:SAM-dependent methyltransferase